MSYTAIYAIKSDKESESVRLIEEFENAWRGAMYVWDQIARDHFGLDSFPFMGDMQSKVWNADKDNGLSEYERIVLNSTMDKATVNKAGLEKLIAAFDEYGINHPNSSISEQAKALKELSDNLEDDELIAWQQTSVGEFWGEIDWDEDGEAVYYNHVNGNIHFDVIENI